MEAFYWQPFVSLDSLDWAHGQPYYQLVLAVARRLRK